MDPKQYQKPCHGHSYWGPSHHLRLKEGAICFIMRLRNMSAQQGLVKNVRVIVEKLFRHTVCVRIINGFTGRLGESVAISRIWFGFTPRWTSWTVRKVQFPLRPAYATTYHDCVNLILLDRTVLDVRTPVFLHDQLYTAPSQVRHHDHSQALFPELQGVNSTSCHDPTAVLRNTINAVYQEMLA
jgi:hypothetical protein